MAIRVGVNGFGRIGRLFVRAAAGDAGLEIVGLNDLTDVDTMAHLFKYDSVHGPYKGDVAVQGDSLVIDGRKMRLFNEKDAGNLKWKDLGVRLVIEATGHYRDRAAAAAHIEKGGAERVIISAPGKNADITVVMGVNDAAYDPKKHLVISAASCTTNCLAPVAKVLDDNFRIVRGLMTTIHSYTNDQRIMDFPHKDLRRARAAAVSMIPTSTGAAKAIGLVLPQLDGKMDGLAIRVPTPDGSIVDLAVEVEKPTTVEEVNRAFRAAADGSLRGCLRYCPDPIVSVDVIGDEHASIFDSQLTKVMGGTLVKVFSWYDNEWGFSNRMVELAKKVMS
jgi:glyceraldehyde 3-phosphate dehydrogenase